MFFSRSSRAVGSKSRRTDTVSASGACSVSMTTSPSRACVGSQRRGTRKVFASSSSSTAHAVPSKRSMV